MPAETLHPSMLDQPARYQIKILGRLDIRWQAWFDGMQMEDVKETGGETITILTGTVVDQTALHGLLEHIRDLCLPLLEVKNLEEKDVR